MRAFRMLSRSNLSRQRPGDAFILRVVFTVALTVCVFPTCTLVEAGFTVTAIGGGGGADAVIVIAAAAILVVSAIALALSVTAAGDGVLAGAV